jgi:hypothetical protein
MFRFVSCVINQSYLVCTSRAILYSPKSQWSAYSVEKYDVSNCNGYQGKFPWVLCLYWEWTVAGPSLKKAMPWLRRLVTGLSPQRPGFDPGSVHVRFVVDKVAVGQVFLFGFPLPVSFHRCSIARKNKKKLTTFIRGLHNKPQGCGASVASAAGPFITKISFKTRKFALTGERFERTASFQRKNA